MEWLVGLLAPEFLIGDSQGGVTSVEAALAELRERGVVCSYVGQRRDGSPLFRFHVAGVFCRCAEDVARALVLQVGGLVSCQVSSLTSSDNLPLRMLRTSDASYTHTTSAITLLRTLQPRPNPAREQLQAEKLRKLAAKLVAPHVRIVIYSPTVESGIDISVPGHFDRMYVYICRFSCLTLGLIQMTGRVRTIRCQTVECLVAPSIRLGSNCRHGHRDRIAAHETLEWLKWAYRAYNTCASGFVEGCQRDPEYGPDGASMVLRETPYLRCLFEGWHAVVPAVG